MTNYVLVQVLNDQLIRVGSAEFGHQLFTSRKLRKARPCASCGIEIPMSATAWAEATSCAANRMERVHGKCIAPGLA